MGLLALATIGSVNLARAQEMPTNAPPTDTNNVPPPDHQQRWQMHEQHMLQRLTQELNLTPTQQTQVQTVFDQMRTNIMTAIQDARTNADSQLKLILTPQQYQQFQTFWQQHEHHWKGHPGWGNEPNETNEQNQPNMPNQPNPPGLRRR